MDSRVKAAATRSKRKGATWAEANAFGNMRVWIILCLHIEFVRGGDVRSYILRCECKIECKILKCKANINPFLCLRTDIALFTVLFDLVSPFNR